MARYVSKEFLSPCAHETGNIVCQIETALLKNIGEWEMDDPSISGSIRVSDCSRTVALDFDCRGQEGFEKRIAKLDKLIGEVQAMRKQYEAMWENHLRNVEHKRRSIEQESIDKAKAKR